MSEHFGIPFGSKQFGTSPVNLIDGLTISRFVQVKVPSSSAGNVSVSTKGGGQTGEGLLIEAGDPVVQLDTRLDPSLIRVTGSIAGCSITYIGVESIQ